MNELASVLDLWHINPSYARLAQLVEHHLDTVEVMGSSPIPRTIFIRWGYWFESGVTGRKRIFETINIYSTSII